MDARGITNALGGKWHGHYGLCRCPVHADRTPSLKVKDDPRKSDGIDVHCFTGCRWGDVKDELARQGLLPQFEPGKREPKLSAPVRRPQIEPDNDAEKRAGFAQKLWQASTPLPETLGFRYFTATRGLDIGVLGDLSHALRWHEGFGAVVALMTDPLGNEPCGIHRTFLNADATKRERKMLGRQGLVHLSPDQDVLDGLGIAEGIETALGVLTSGWAPVWAATSSGGVQRFPPLGGIESLTIFADPDPPGMGAATTCARWWTNAGREVRIAHPKDAT